MLQALDLMGIIENEEFYKLYEIYHKIEDAYSLFRPQGPSFHSFHRLGKLTNV